MRTPQQHQSLNNGKVASAPDRVIADRVGLGYVRKGF